MQNSIVLVLFFLAFGTMVHGEVLSLGAPIKNFDGNKIWVFEWAPNDFTKCKPICTYTGLHIAYTSMIGDAKDITFVGVTRYFELRGGGFWNRLGFGFGIFDKQSEEIRVPWDFSISVLNGFDFWKNWSMFIGFQHWSNGRSFARNLGLRRYWPEHNDGGNSGVLGIRYYFQ